MRWAFLVLFTLFLTACTSNKLEEGSVEVGIIGPFSGPAAQFGAWGREGFELGSQKVSEDTGLRMNYIFEDDMCEGSGTVNALNKLHYIDRQTYILGLPCGSGTKAATPLTQEGNVLVITAGDNFGYESDYWYSTRFAIEKEAEVLAHFAYYNLSLRKTGIIYFENEWGVGAKDAFITEFGHLGGEIVGAESYGWGASDFRTSLLKFREADADSVYMIFNDVGDIVNQIAELQMDVTKLGDSQIETEQSVRVGGTNLEGVVYARPQGKPSESSEEFIAQYTAANGRAPDTITIDSYDAALVLGHALAKCPDRDIECVRHAVQNTKNLPGASGLLTFNEDIWGFEKHFVIKTFKDGAFAAYE